MITREEAHEKLHFGNKLSYLDFNILHEGIEEIYDGFEKKETDGYTSCENCVNKTDVYLEVCGMCKHYYGDYFEKKNKTIDIKDKKR